MKRQLKWAGILAGACALACGFGIYNVSSVEANAVETPLYWEGFSIDGLAIRTTNPTGLRFKTVAERLTPTMKKYNPDAEYYTTITLTTNGREYKTNVNTEVWRDEIGWNTVVLGIPQSDYETQITAQSFIRLNGKEEAFYQTEPVTISIAQTAAAGMSYGMTSDYITQYVEDIVTSVTLDKATASIEQGQTLQLQATTSPENYMVKWTSSNTDIATVDNYGKVKGKSVGSATITAEINGYTASCQVTVTSRDETLAAFPTTEISYSVFGDRNATVTGSKAWFNNVFADERVDAVTFNLKNTKEMTVTTTPSFLSGTLAATTVTMTVTRSMNEVWQASGDGDLVIESNLSTISTGTLTFSNFAKVWATDDVSKELTEEEIAELSGIPEYRYNSYKFDFMGYSSLTDGTWKEYNAETGEVTTVTGSEDYRNVYRIEEYKDAGMTMLLPQSACSIARSEGDAFDFANSEAKKVLDMSAEAGINKVILSDLRLYALCEDATESIIGDGKAFATEADLDAKIKTYMSPYVNHPAFYGVMLLDEPVYTKLAAQGDVYRAIKRCYPNVYIQCNLHPSVGEGIGSKYPPIDDHQDLVEEYKAKGYDDYYAQRFAAYELYLTMFLDYTGADYIMYDHYPIKESGLYASYIGSMQTAANVAAKRGVKFYFASQTMTMQESAESTYDYKLTEEDLRWLNNMQLGLGVKQFAYFTYFTKQAASAEQRFNDGGSFITNNGEKTDIYYYMREIMAENQAFANTILSFDYKTSAAYIANGTGYGITNAQSCIQGSLAKVQSVDVNTESALVSELYDKRGDRYMYMIQNITNPAYQTAGTLQTVKLTFNEDYEYAIVWKNGEKSIVKLENNTYVVKQNAGEAVYVIPFNVDEDANGDYVYDSSSGDNGAWFPGSSNGESPYEGLGSGGKGTYVYDGATGDNGAWFPSSEAGKSPW